MSRRRPTSTLLSLGLVLSGFACAEHPPDEHPSPPVPQALLLSAGDEVLGSETSTFIFDQRPVGSPGAPVVFTLRNMSSDPVELYDDPPIGIAGDAAADFSVVSPPDTLLAPGASTTFSIVFTPNRQGSRRADLVITNDASPAGYRVHLAGDGGIELFMAAGENGRRTFSRDGQHWKDAPAGNAWNLRGVCAFAGLFVVVGGDANEGGVLVSPDGLQWTQIMSSTEPLLDCVQAASSLVVLGEHTMHVSHDGLTWPDVVTLETQGRAFRRLTHGDITFVAVGEDGLRTSSQNGVDWTPPVLGGDTLIDVAYEHGTFVAIGADRRIQSSDGVKWDHDTRWSSEMPGGAPPSMQAIMSGHNVLLATSADGRMARLRDGEVQWSYFTGPALRSVSYGETRLTPLSGADVFVGIGAENQRWFSTDDGATWSGPVSDPGSALNRILYGGL